MTLDLCSQDVLSWLAGLPLHLDGYSALELLSLILFYLFDVLDDILNISHVETNMTITRVFIWGHRCK